MTCTRSAGRSDGVGLSESPPRQLQLSDEAARSFGADLAELDSYRSRGRVAFLEPLCWRAPVQWVNAGRIGTSVIQNASVLLSNLSQFAVCIQPPLFLLHGRAFVCCKASAHTAWCW